jgi:TrmH family RNA methyltransferase
LRGRGQLGCFAIEGIRLVERGLRAGASIEHLVAARSFLQAPDPRCVTLLETIKAAKIPLHVVADGIVEEFTGPRSIGAVIGLVRIPEETSLSTILSREGSRSLRLLIGVDIEDPGNVGALVRTALASGAAAFISVGITEPYHPRAVRTSMGSLYKLAILHRQHLESLQQELRDAEVLTVGAVSSGGSSPETIARHEGHLALCLGSEAFGLSPGVLESLDRQVTIPMKHGVDSYSVNAAAAVLLYALRGPGPCLDPCAKT